MVVYNAGAGGISQRQECKSICLIYNEQPASLRWP